MKFAEIILPLALPQTLTYGIPENLQSQIKIGIRVEVALGKNKVFSGLVFALHDNLPRKFRVKSIQRILDKEPIVTETQLKFWSWVSSYYCCTIGEVMQAALPAHLKLMNDTLLIWDESVIDIPDGLSDEGYLLAEALQIKKKLTIAEARMATDGKNHAKAISEILEYGLAKIQDELKEKYQPKIEEFVLLNPVFEKDEALLSQVFESLERAPRQNRILLSFFQIHQKKNIVPLKELLKQAQCSRASLNALTQKGVLEINREEINRIRLKDPMEEEKGFSLAEEQETALKQIEQQWQENPVVLLQGVTGSGKTMIYIRLIKDQIQKGKQVLLLLPEIALTTQVVQRLRKYFGEELGVYHSRFSNNERVEVWKRLQKRDFKIILGPRSALWLPYQDLGLVIVDEEHEPSYKQFDLTPRFQGRDAAIYLANLSKSKVLLGSATPSLESAHNVQTGKYGFAKLTKRYMDQPMPEVHIVSAKNTQPALSSILTIPLLNAINEAFSLGKQVLLFQNKRGYAPFLICSVCGFVPHCPQCDVSLTYHKATDKLHCHYCGQHYAPIRTCPQCGSTHIVARSYGTEKIEEELQRIYPKHKIARMDTDSVRGKNKMQQIIRDFEKGSIDILVGTQMIVKGLDFENVGLVGILSADSLWSFPDFRVNERAFQLMEQVSGRAGRSNEGVGKVYIQAYNLKHPLLKWVKDHDYRGFYINEIHYRRQFGYPPFTKLVRVTFKHQKQEKAAHAANLLAQALRQESEMIIQGPTPAIVSRVRDRYLFEVWVKLSRSRDQLTLQKQAIIRHINEVLSLRGNSSIQAIIDVDP